MPGSAEEGESSPRERLIMGLLTGEKIRENFSEFLNLSLIL